VRYGTPLYLVVLAVMIGYLAVILAAEATATAKLIGAVSDLPAWLPAGVTLLAALIYTGVGGLSASIVTDRQQMAIILPFVLALVGVGAYVALTAPELKAAGTPILALDNARAWETAGALFLAILFTNVLNQGNWQRVFAVRDARAVRASMGWAALIAAPVVILVGAFGILHTAMGLDDPSAALIAVAETALPAWLMILMAVLGVALVLSSMDTALNALASLVVVAARTARPAWERRRLLRLGTAASAVAAAIALGVAIQGWSVLYLFLCADLLCAAMAVPVFAGLYLPSYGARLAGASFVAGLAAGLLVFPAPDMSGGSLLGAFALAAGVPLLMTPLCKLSGTRFDAARLRHDVVAYGD
jgi:Na+/proline symporter